MLVSWWVTTGMGGRTGTDWGGPVSEAGVSDLHWMLSTLEPAYILPLSHASDKQQVQI